MRDIPVEKKIELLQQIRARSQRDRYDLYHREKALYGRTTPLDEISDSFPDEEETPSLRTFPLRAMIAAGLFALIILSDRTGRSVAGVQADSVFTAIATDYENAVAAWADSILNGSPARP